MLITNVEKHDRSFTIQWNNGETIEAPFIWLRDNDQDELHPDTHERTFDLTSVPLDIKPIEFDIDTDQLHLSIKWPNKNEPSVYWSDWLYAHRPGVGRQDPAKVAKRSWTSSSRPVPEKFDAQRCHSDDPALVEALSNLKQTGLIIIDNLDDDPMAGERFGDLIGFKRETNYGVMFEVINKPDPNNLAYTALELPLHTDLSNQEFVPGNQFLHCFKNTATGGRSVFADGMAVVEDFKRECFEEYDLLVKLPVPWRFIDDRDDIRHHRPIIGLDADGLFSTLTFNAHLADIPDFEPDMMYSFYAAYRNLMSRIRSERYRIEYQLQAGEMAIFDNQRVLHGRSAFDPNSGERHLRGFYVEHNEINSRMRKIAAKNNE